MNVLITGQNGYIAKMLRAHLLNCRHNIRLLDVRGDSWRDDPFTGIDSIVHLAAIVHNSSNDPAEYGRVNTGLTAALARKAKDDGVPQFIFASSMAVFGKSDAFAPLNEITSQTPLAPSTLYGKSKLAAEREVAAVYGGRACILRPPMVYGENCPGNYRKLRRLVLRLKAVPRCENRRGMIYIQNLCGFIRLLIENSGSGVFHPQDADTPPTCELARLIGAENGVKVRALPVPFLKQGAVLVPELKKAFGSLSYDPAMTVCPYGEYRLFDTPGAVAQTEKNWTD